MLKKSKDSLLVVIGLCIIVLTVIGYLYFNLSSNLMYFICIADVILMVLLLYICNYKDHHYGGNFKKDFPDAN